MWELALAIAAFVALVGASVLSGRRATAASKERASALAAAKAEGRMREFALEQIESLAANAPIGFGLIATLGLIHGRICDIPWQANFAISGVYLGLGLAAMSRVRAAVSRSAALSLIVVGVAFAASLLSPWPGWCNGVGDLESLAVFAFLASIPGIAAAVWTFRYHALRAEKE